MCTFDVLCTDYETDRLFWIDTKEHVLISSDMNGGKRSILLTSSRFIRHAVAVTVFEVTCSLPFIIIISSSSVENYSFVVLC